MTARMRFIRKKAPTTIINEQYNIARKGISASIRLNIKPLHESVEII